MTAGKSFATFVPCTLSESVCVLTLPCDMFFFLSTLCLIPSQPGESGRSPCEPEKDEEPGDTSASFCYILLASFLLENTSGILALTCSSLDPVGLVAPSLGVFHLDNHKSFCLPGGVNWTLKAPWIFSTSGKKQKYIACASTENMFSLWGTSR
jgi:hypothetical protein